MGKLGELSFFREAGGGGNEIGGEGREGENLERRKKNRS